jgi:hypothetical protein
LCVVHKYSLVHHNYKTFENFGVSRKEIIFLFFQQSRDYSKYTMLEKKYYAWDPNDYNLARFQIPTNIFNYFIIILLGFFFVFSENSEKIFHATNIFTHVIWYFVQ